MRNIAKIDYLIRLGLGKSDDKLTYYRQAVVNPVKSVSNPILREYVADLLNDLLDFVFDDPTTWNRLLTVLQKQKNKKNEEEEMADNEIVEDIESGPDPLKKKLDDQRQQLQKQKDQIRLQLQQKKAQKQIQTMKQKGQQQLAKEDEEIDENRMGYVYDPLTRKKVPRKGPKVKVGGGVKNITPEDRYKEYLAKKKTDEEIVDEVAIAQDKSGRANYWYRQHTNRYQMYLRNGDIAKAELHRKKAIEFKRRSYDALDNPEKQFS